MGDGLGLGGGVACIGGGAVSDADLCDEGSGVWVVGSMGGGAGGGVADSLTGGAKTSFGAGVALAWTEEVSRAGFSCTGLCRVRKSTVCLRA